MTLNLASAPSLSEHEPTIIRYLSDPFGFLGEVMSKLLTHALPILLFVTIAIVAIVFVGVAIRFMRSRLLPKAARRLAVFPPSAVNPDGAATLWMNLHALLRPWWARLLFGQPPLAWEVSGDEAGTLISMWVPRSVPPGLVERAVESAWPGARVQESPNDSPLEGSGNHVSVCEMVLAEPDHFPIGEGAGRDPLRMVLGPFGILGEREQAVVQVVATPVTSTGRHRLRGLARRLRRGRNSLILSPRRPGSMGPDPALDLDVKTILAKAASPLWSVSVRIGVSSPDRSSARGKIHALAGAFAVFEGRNGFRRRRAWRGRKRLAERSAHPSSLLSSFELASIADLPSAEALPGLPRPRARSVAPPRDLPVEGKPLGISDRRRRPVAISVEDASHHLHVIGETGTGKSTLIARMVLADAAAGRGAVVIDPKGDLVGAIVDRLSESALGNTCLLDPEESEMAVGLNVLAGEDTDLVVDHIVSVFKRIYEGAWGPRSDDIMRAACLTLTHLTDATLAEVPLLLTNKELRTKARWILENQGRAGDLRVFWDWYEQLGEQQRAMNTAPLMNKLRAFLLRGHVKAIIGQAKPKLDIGELLESGGLLLVRIPKGTLGEETSRILGAFVVARVWQAAMKRAALPHLERKPIGLYIDEMHNYLALPRSFEDMLAEARAYGLSLVLAHQHMGQLPNAMRDALSANARTKVVFACAPDDAKLMAKHFEPSITDGDLGNLATFQAACRPCLNGGHGAPFTFTTEPLAGLVPGRASQVKEAAAKHFAKPRSDVDAEIRLRQLRYRAGNP